MQISTAALGRGRGLLGPFKNKFHLSPVFPGWIVVAVCLLSPWAAVTAQGENVPVLLASNTQGTATVTQSAPGATTAIETGNENKAQANPTSNSDEVQVMPPPKMHSWNLGLRFAMELTAWTGLGVYGYQLSGGSTRFVYAALLPAAAITFWGVFNVPEDPSRSGQALVTVPGWVRLSIELLTFAAGTAAWAAAGGPEWAVGLASATAIHYTVSWPRVQWLSRQ